MPYCSAAPAFKPPNEKLLWRSEGVRGAGAVTAAFRLGERGDLGSPRTLLTGATLPATKMLIERSDFSSGWLRRMESGHKQRADPSDVFVARLCVATKDDLPMARIKLRCRPEGVVRTLSLRVD